MKYMNYMKNYNMIKSKLMKTFRCDILIQYFLITFFALSSIANAQNIKKPAIPVIASDWWTICTMPDLGQLNGSEKEKQHIVDHGFIRDSYGNWQLWACIRGMATGRILYRWEGKNLEKGPWQSKGVALRADSLWGEQTNPERVQAPYFMFINSKYYCFYNTKSLHQLISDDGVEYRREKISGRADNILFTNSGRDVMILHNDSIFYAYLTKSYTKSEDSIQGHVVVRTSRNMLDWTEPITVCKGGVAGPGAVSAESPFVIKKDGFFYLFRASSHDFKTYVYRSETPLYFGNNDDHNLIAVLPVKAPEIIYFNGKYYISDLHDFQGIRLALLEWKFIHDIK